MKPTKKILDNIVWWINERERIRLLKDAGKEYTTTNIFNRKRFCNVLFEDDKVSRFVAENILARYPECQQVMASMLFRCFNRPHTWQMLRPFCDDPCAKTLAAVKREIYKAKADGVTLFSSSFMTLPKNGGHQFHELVCDFIMPGMLESFDKLNDVSTIHAAFDWNYDIDHTMRFTSYVAALDTTMPGGIFENHKSTLDFCHPGSGPKMLIGIQLGLVKSWKDKLEMLTKIKQADCLEYVREVYDQVVHSDIPRRIKSKAILAHAEYWCCETYKYISGEMRFNQLNPEGSK
jgi:hypothetical protein